MALTRLPSFTLLSTDSYTFGNANVTGNITAGNLKTDNLFYANGDPYVFTTDASGSNTQIQFNDANSFAGSANLTFDKTTKTLTVDNIKTDYLFYSNGNAWSFATEAQGNLADSAVQPGDLALVATSGNYTDLTNLPSLFDGEYSSLANAPALFSGSYVDLTNKPTLGTAAATDATAYATAAQGTKADTALQAANLTGYATELYVGNAIANLIDSAPGALDTLNELANALGDDANFAGNLTNTLANKLDSSAFTYANITGAPTLGNIVTINLDGNTSNILYGNGVFSSAPVTYGDSNVEAYLPNYAGALTPGNITIAPANLKISGGTANYVLSTDGAGNLSWAAQSGGSGVSDLANLTDVTLANLTQGDILSYDAANSTWINTVNAGGTGSASSQYVTRTATGDGSTVDYTVSTGATTNSVIVTLSGIVQTPTSDYSVSGTTLTFTSAPANGIAIQIREIGIPMSSGSNTQLLFNDAGSIGGTSNLTFNKSSGMLTAAKLTTTSANLGSAANLKITGGNIGDLLATVGNGVLAWANVAANGNVIINTTGGGGGASVTVSDTTPETPAEGDLWLDSESGELNVYFSDAWAAVSASAGQLDIQVNNFTGDGTQTEFTLTVTPAGSNYTIVTVGGVTQPRNYYSVSGATLTFSSPPPNNTPIEVSIFGGTASPIGLAGAVSNGAQPNITSVGTLTSLVVSGNATVGNLKTDNLLYANGSAYEFTSTAAGSNTQIQFNNDSSFAGSANLTFNNTTNTLAVTNITVASANLGSASNLIITGGTNGQMLTSNGSGGVSWSAAPAGFTASKAYTLNLLFGG